MIDQMNAFYQALVVFLPHLLVGIVIMFCMFVVALMAKWSIQRIASKTRRNLYLFDIFASSAKTVIVIIGVIMALGTIGVNITALVTSLGLAGFALGLAIKDPLSNMISGVMLLHYQPFHVGDYIDVSGKNAGKVTSISLRYTRLEVEGDRVLIPNNTVLNATLTVKKA